MKETIRFHLLMKLLMKERMEMRHSIWLFSGTLLNPKAMLPIMLWITGVIPSVGSCDAADMGFFSAVPNILVNEEIFLEDSIITESISSRAVPRFLFFIISATGICFCGVMAEP